MASPDLGGAERIEVRSFRAVFALERRLHSIDRWRLPLPYGVPLRGLAYAAAVLVAVVLAGRMPVLGGLVGLVPAPLRYAVAPVAAATLLVRLRLDGRPAHGFLAAWARHRLSAAHVSAFRPVPRPGSEIRIAGDIAVVAGSEQLGRLSGRLRGPARVLVRAPVRVRQQGTRLTVTPLGGPALRRGRTLTLMAGQELAVAFAEEPAR